VLRMPHCCAAKRRVQAAMAAAAVDTWRQCWCMCGLGKLGVYGRQAVHGSMLCMLPVIRPVFMVPNWGVYTPGGVFFYAQ
jgi:hypothetical protein